MTSIEILQPGDEERFEAFLLEHADSSMFLRSNVRQAGFVDDGRRFGGAYAAASRDGAIVGVVGHAWMGNLMLQAPESMPELLDAVTRASGRPVRGLVGPWDQVIRARRLLGMQDRPLELESRDLLFALELADLAVPPPLRDGTLRLRRAGEHDGDALGRWSAAYALEILGATDSEELRARTRRDVDELTERGHYFVLEDDRGRRLGCTAFNAVLPDTVQVGGVFTPPALRSRGYARAAVAGSLLIARAEGARRSILFTGEDNHAQRPYRAIGYREVGDYGLILFEDGTAGPAADVG